MRNCESISRNAIFANLNDWLTLVDGLPLPSTAKLWLYQHFVVAKMSWHFTALDLSLTFVKRLQTQANKFLKAWSGLPRPANTAILFVGASGRAGLHVSGLPTFWKQMQAVRLDLLRHSADPRCCRLYDMLVRRQSRWARKYPPAVEHACAATVVDANPPASSTQSTQQSLRPREPRLDDRRQRPRKRILNIIRDIDIEEQLAKLRTLQIQGRWLEWTDVMNGDLSWRRLIHGLDDAELRFTLQVITNTAPTPDNLRRWGQSTIDPACNLCGRPCTLRHVLNACSVALRQGRYTWRHDSVLGVLRRHLLRFWSSLQREPRAPSDARFIRFVRPLENRSAPPSVPSHPRRPLPFSDALRCATDWEFRFDIGMTQTDLFPPEIAVTLQRPDIVIFSRSKRQVILVELTIPLEDRVAQANERKQRRYADLLSKCEENGWHATHFPVEVGCRGFVAFSLVRCLRDLGFPRCWAKRVRTECSRVALRCSYLLYLRRAIPEWSSMAILDTS